MNHGISFKKKLAYGVGDFGSNFAWTYVSAFALIYFTDTVGIEAAAVGTLILISKILDGVTDVFIGNLIDRTKSRMGKARPWLFWSSFPLVISLILIFNVPEAVSHSGKLAYIFITYTLMSAFFYTASNIAYNALVALVTDVPEDRVTMGSLRFIFAVLAGATISTITMKLVETFGTGQRGWLMVSLLYSAIFLVFTLITVFGVREMKQEGEQAGTDAGEEKSAAPLGKSIILLLKNRYFIVMLGIYILNYIYTGISSGLGIYYASYVLGNPTLLGVLSGAMLLPMIIGLIISPKLTGKFGMKKACFYGMLLSIAAGIILILSNNSLPVVIAGIALRWLGSTPMVASMYALVAETAEYAALRFNTKMDGMIFSCTSVGIKVGTGLGTALTGWLLAWGKYNGLAEIQPQSAIDTISGLYLVSPLLVSAGLAVLLYFLNVERENKNLRARKI